MASCWGRQLAMPKEARGESPKQRRNPGRNHSTVAAVVERASSLALSSLADATTTPESLISCTRIRNDAWIR